MGRGGRGAAGLRCGVDAAAAIAWLSLAAWSALALIWWRGMRRLAVLAPAGDDDGADEPRVAVVVAARDEASTPEAAASLARAARSWLALEGVSLEVVVVDDRSSDATPQVLRAALGDDARVRTLRVEALPVGWIGKVHAQAMGVAATRAPWVLLTDADVRLHPRSAAVAVRHAERHALDHLGLLPRFAARGWALRAFVTGFALLLTVLVRPWEADDPRSPRTLGVGAFGLYRRSALAAAGGLAAVRSRPDDDLALARAVKAGGGRSAVAFGPGLAEVDWYPSLAAALRGLEKNAFGGVGFRLDLLAAAVVGLLATHVAPFAWALLGPSAARAPSWGVVAVVFAVYAWHGRRAGHAAWLAFAHPVAVLLLIAALLRSAAAALLGGGVRWRGRRYPLVELRAAARADAERDRRAARARRLAARDDAPQRRTIGRAHV